MLKQKISEYFELIKFEHTIFALPFAISGMLLATPKEFPPLMTFLWVLLAMVGGRTAGMGLNRIIDAEIDKKNPRTSNREIPSGKIKKKSALILAVFSFILLIIAGIHLPKICQLLLPVAIILITVYSYTKRFTSLCHLFLGAVLGAAASGGWLAVSGHINLPVIMWGVAVLLWAAGFDIIYALQDIEFDRENGLHSIPCLLGIKKSLLVSKIFHIISIMLLYFLALFYVTGFFYKVGLIFFALMLRYEHSLIKENDLSKINAAFFNVNGYISIGFMLFILINKFFWIIK